MDTILSFLKNWADIFLSALVALGGFWAYMRHDKKLKQQEIKLNELQIKQYEKEEAKEKMAEMKANVIRDYRGNVRIRFFNAGKANAKNVRIEIQSPKEKMSRINHPKFGPYDVINPQSHREEQLVLYTGHPKTIDFKITWDDESHNNRSVSLSVPL